MTWKKATIESRVRLSAVMVILGLLIEAFSLKWAHPTAFLLFAFVGMGLMGLGILVYLYSIVSLPAAEAHDRKGIDRRHDQSKP